MHTLHVDAQVATHFDVEHLATVMKTILAHQQNG